MDQAGGNGTVEGQRCAEEQFPRQRVERDVLGEVVDGATRGQPAAGQFQVIPERVELGFRGERAERGEEHCRDGDEHPRELGAPRTNVSEQARERAASLGNPRQRTMPERGNAAKDERGDDDAHDDRPVEGGHGKRQQRVRQHAGAVGIREDPALGARRVSREQPA